MNIFSISKEFKTNSSRNWIKITVLIFSSFSNSFVFAHNGKHFTNGENSETQLGVPFWQNWEFIVVCILLFIVSVLIYVKVRLKRIELTQKMKSEYDQQIYELESKALRAQMNPHFLFNSLNSIRLFILKNEVDSASNYVAKFSKLLRMILNHSRQELISVYDEIQALKLYLDFERLRFDQGFEFDLQIEGQDVLDCKIPPMIIQPFIENAIWHGLMARRDEQGYINVTFKKIPEKLFVTVRDNGIGRDKAAQLKGKNSLKEGSLGLQITKDRLRSLTMRTKRMNDFTIEDLTDKQGVSTGTLITLYFETND